MGRMLPDISLAQWASRYSDSTASLSSMLCLVVMAAYGLGYLKCVVLTVLHLLTLVITICTNSCTFLQYTAAVTIHPRCVCIQRYRGDQFVSCSGYFSPQLDIP